MSLRGKLPPMKARWIIIDGYSLLHRAPAPAKIGTAAREQLVARLGATGEALAERITVVFDGAGFVGERQAQPPAPVEVIYATAAQTADSVIERLAHEATRPEEILVVTSDRAERETVDAAGVATLGCSDFLHHLAATENTLRRSASNLKHQAPPAVLGDFFPKRDQKS
ncbi:MAG: RNA-binding protein [Verrucomicrobia bacterium]|nr:MAG: RNA-binding protein [Verrucomicrobiota bacterium]